MTRITTIALLAFSCGAVCTSPVFAQATRTWVSGVGDDANPCSRTAPCKTFAGAISRTAAGGEINCLDPGGFGGVTITKAISIICQYTEGGVLSAGAGVSSIIVNAGASDNVYLRGLDFHGAGSAQNGVRFIAGASLTIEDSVIRRYNATNGLGILFQPSGASQLFINNTTISNNGSGNTGGGILIQPTGAAGTARVELTNVRVTGNANAALRLDSTGNTGFGIIVTVEDSQFSGSNTGISVVNPAATTSIQMLMNDSIVADNTTGFSANGGGNRILVANTTITHNNTGLSISGGAIINSFGNNRLEGNFTTDGTFTPPVVNPE